jgi:hypothetical protein
LFIWATSARIPARRIPPAGMEVPAGDRAWQLGR